MNVLIGGTGFLGGAVAEAMVKRNLPLRCLVRKGADISKLTQLNVELCEAFLGQLWGGQSAESRVNTGSLPEKCQKGSATEYPFIS